MPTPLQAAWTRLRSGLLDARCASLFLLALLAPSAHALTVTVTGSGQVVSVPAGISCGNGATACTASFAAGTNVMLAAVPASGSSLTAWSGVCTGLALQCFPVNIAGTLTASFGAANSAVAMSAVSNGNTCLVTTSGRVECWGSSPIGLAAGTGAVPATVIGTAPGVVAVSLSTWTACTLQASGSVQCWGDNTFGELGVPPQSTVQTQPVQVDGLFPGTVQVVTGDTFSCALSSGGAVQCWGAGANLGNGTGIDSWQPVPVTGLQSGVTAIAAGWGHACALTSTGGVQCWGGNGSGQLGNGTYVNALAPVPVTGLQSGVANISTGGDHSCAVTSLGAAQCWGYDAWGQVGDGQTLSSPNTPRAVPALAGGVASIHAGYDHSCALTTAGAVLCWGYGASGELGNGNLAISLVPVATTLTTGVAALAQGPGAQECARLTSGSLSCWGSNTQSAAGVLGNQPSPVSPWVANVAVHPLISGGSVTSAPAGISCGVACYAQFGFGSAVTLTASPTPGNSFAGWSGGRCSGTAACNLTADGGIPVTATFNSPLTVSVSGSGSVISSPAGINCPGSCTASFPSGLAVTLTATPGAGNAFATWGGSATGSAATTSVAISAPAVVSASFNTTPTLTVVTSPAAGGTVTSLPAGINCGASCSANFAFGSTVTLTATPAAGSLFQGWSAPCGTALTCSVAMSAAGSVTASFGPPGLTVNVSGTGTVTSNPAGINCTSSCSSNFAPGTVVTLTAAAGAGQTFVGWYGAGCTGTGTCTVTLAAAATVTASFLSADFAWSLSTSTDHSCLLTSAGVVRCWGANATGQLGNGTAGASSTPMLPLISAVPNTFIAVAAGTGHTCAVHSANVLWCWGLGTSGQLGGLNFSSTLSPFTPLTAGAVQAVAAGGNHTCVVSTAGAVRCTGANNLGQLGNGGGANSNAFVQVTGLTAGWTAVAAGSNHNCALNSAGGVVCWGDNSFGQLGNGTLASSPVPTQVTGLTSGVRALAAGTETSCALMINGTVQCWGNNTYGQLGGGPVGNVPTPVTASGFSTATSVATSGFHTCVGTSDGADHCFGLNVFGQLGPNSGTLPASVGGLPAGVLTVSTGVQQSCALLTTGQILCWGLGTSGELGQGTFGTFTAPQPLYGSLPGIVPSVPSIQTVTVGDGTVTPQLLGTSCGPGCYAYPLNSAVPLAATPLAGGSFSGWLGACTGTAPCTVRTSAPLGLTATFGQPVLTVTVLGTGTVSAHSGGNFLNCSGGQLPCAQAFDQGAAVTLSASGGTFTGWSGACTGAGPCTVTMGSSLAVTANFSAAPTPVTGALLVTLSGAPGGAFRGGNTVLSTPAGISCTPGLYSVCGFNFAPGAAVTLTAVSEFGSQFVAWSGACSGTGPTCTVLAPNNDIVTADFTAAAGLNLQVNGAGSVTSSPAGLACTAGAATGCQVAVSATAITLTATPSAGRSFAGWSGGPCDNSTTTSCVLPASFAGTIGATFGSVCVTAALNGTGSGRIDSNLGPLPLCDLSGQVLNLHPEAAPGSVAGAWTGACAAQSGTLCVLPFPATSQSLGVSFTAGSTVNVIKVGNGTGTVTSSSGGINCGATCSTNSLAYGVPVTLTPVAAAGSVFRGWGGACSGTANCVLDMTQSPLAVSASFYAPLITTQVGVGGTVQSTPAGIACLGYLTTSDFGTCSATFANAGAVTLTATPLNGYSFFSWGGACLGQTTTVCTLSSVSADTVVTVSFNTTGTTGAQTLTTTVVGGGSIGSNSVTLCTSGSCPLLVAVGTSLTLTASPAPGFSFTGWSGACTGTASCTAVMNASVAVTATFSPAISVSVSGGGTVTSAPAGISCSTNCASTIPFGTALTLTATPAAGQVFTGWVGDGCSGTGTCAISATTPLTVTATFAAAVPATASGDVPLPPWALAGLALLLSALLGVRGAPARGRADHH